MAMEYGSGGSLSVTMDGPFAGSGGGSDVKLEVISAPAANWKGGESPYSQVIAADGVTVTSKLDVQLSEEQIRHFKNTIIAFQAVNNSGVITLYAYGSMPDVDMEIQATISEVLGEGVILGDIFTTTNPQADYGQDDPTKADYIKNKPNEAIAKAQSTADSGKQIAEAALARSGGTMTGPINMGTNKITDLKAPENGTDAANKTYVDEKRKTHTATLTTGGWSSAAPYTQTVSVSGIQATDMPHISPVYSDTLATALLEKEAWSLVNKAVAASGSITFTCFEEKPVTAIPIQVEVVR